MVVCVPKFCETICIQCNVLPHLSTRGRTLLLQNFILIPSFDSDEVFQPGLMSLVLGSKNLPLLFLHNAPRNSFLLLLLSSLFIFVFIVLFFKGEIVFLGVSALVACNPSVLFPRLLTVLPRRRDQRT